MDGSQIEYFSDEFNELCTQALKGFRGSSKVGVESWGDFVGSKVCRVQGFGFWGQFRVFGVRVSRLSFGFCVSSGLSLVSQRW